MRKIGGIIMLSLINIMMIFNLSGCTKKELVVGKDINKEDINEFYLTYDSSAYPPYFERYHFYIEDDKYYFRHELREGDHWPLSEDDVKVNDIKELDEDKWNEFYEYLKEGTVRKRSENLTDGDSGPWTYLYHKKDKGDIQEYSFVSYDRRLAFENFCKSLIS